MGPVVRISKHRIFCLSAKKNRAPFYQLLSLEGIDMSSAFDKLWKGKAIDKLPKRKLEAERWVKNDLADNRPIWRLGQSTELDVSR